MKIRNGISFLIAFILMLILPSACGLFHPKLPDPTSQNLPPETHITFFIYPDTTLGPGDYWLNDGDTVQVTDSLVLGLDTTISVQKVHWWGDDPDGDVIGYWVRWSYMDTAVFTTEESAVFYLPLRTQFDIYSLFVAAVDNDSLSDPTPAVLSFPVFNSPPSVEWKLNSLPQSTRLQDSVHYSFTHHSFFWDVRDIDGLETVTDVFYALDDTSDWRHLPGEQRDVMLTDIPPGPHRFYLKVRDIAGAESEIIRFPDPQSEDSKIRRWEVKEPLGDILIVNDYQNDQLVYQHQNLYSGIIESLVGTEGYSVWEIGGASTNTANTIPYSPEDIERNLSSFSRVFWYTFRGENSINASALALTRFVAQGGLLFMNNASTALPDTSWNFTDIASVYRYSPTGRIYPGVNILADWGDPGLDSLLKLKVSMTLADRLYALNPGPTSTLRYFFEHDSLNTSDYTGMPPVMVETPVNEGKCYFLSVPLYYLNGNNNLDELFKHIFELE
ncbi:MAG: hypothetical protein PHX07_05000 [Candidatus Marinimicrobia bacterium]|jgi:hypothetical protein|nr:hypothetical protein [Candidatus Neomarinimicrobiota bacterium]MDD4961573.1 hypothetical protein [Candidatus Neomarinimicrobiota bacterium]MDD5710295.1 hypothetical protein [Candidatus Neomarinimicrobiota bacterium]MDX9778012.1 hypothetical protein [bacterium]